MSTTSLAAPTGTYESSNLFRNVLENDATSLRTPLSNTNYDQWLRDWDREDNKVRIAAAQRQSAQLIVRFLAQWRESYPNLDSSTDREVRKYVKLTATMLPRFQLLDFYRLAVTKDDSVLFQLRYGSLRAYVELHFGDEEEIELLYNLTKDKEIVSAYGGAVEKTLAKLFEAINA